MSMMGSQTALVVTESSSNSPSWPLKLSLVVPPPKLSSGTVPSESTPREYAIANRYRTRNSMKALLAILSNYTIISACILLDEAMPSLFLHNHPILSIILYFFCAAIIASRMRAFENLVHEASHHHLFVCLALHEQLEFLYAFPVFRIVGEYRRAHMIHHKHLGDPKRDPDVLRLYELGLDQLPQRPVWLLFGVPLTGFLTFEWLTTTFLDFWTSSASLYSKITYWLAVSSLVWYSNTFQLLVYYYLIPLVIILPIPRYWAEASEHIGLDHTTTFGHSRSNLGLLHALYMHPHNDGYHAVHHLHSQVPFHALPKAYESLMQESPEFRTNTVVSKGMIETFRQMVSVKTIWKHGA